MAWTEERIALLTQYWEEGRSASQIAELLGEGLSRNAVIGKAHRLGLASRPSPLKTGESKTEAKAPRVEAKAAAPRPAAPRPAPAPAAALTVASAAAQARPTTVPTVAQPVLAEAPAPVETRATPRPKGGRVTLLDLNDRICKWPIGHPDEPDFHFCGKPVNPGFPYCGEHCLVAYQAQMPRRDRPAGPPRPFGPNLPRPR
jgi:GcrA cell cycle regulator